VDDRSVRQAIRPITPQPSRSAKVCYLGKAVPLSSAALLVGPLESHHDPRRFWPKGRAQVDTLAEIEAI